MQRSRLPLYAGIALIAVGWVAIGLAWYQAGRQELEVGQIPYLISGGFGGWALILMGVGAILLHMFLTVMATANRHADQLVEALKKVERAAGRGGSGGGGGRSRGGRGRGRGGGGRGGQGSGTQAGKDSGSSDD